jgi:type III secretion system YscD/HrpQ family protein
VVIDELVWQNMNALFLSNPDWQGVTTYAASPGKFVLKGYVQNSEQYQLLGEYINANFPYPNLLDNQVVIETNLQMQIQSLLIEGQYPAVSFSLTGGDLILSGRVEERDADALANLIKRLEAVQGIVSVKNFIVYGTVNSARIDISDKYTVTGFSVGNNQDQFVVINQKIFSVGDFINGMLITDIGPSSVSLEKDGIKFRINYNLQ